MLPLSKSINIHDVFMNGHPRMRGISTSYLMSITTNSTRNMNLSTFISTYISIPTGLLTNLSSNCKVIFIIVKLRKPIL